MTDLTRVKDLLDLPDQIRKGDFVVKLSEGVRHVDETVSSYVVTPGIAQAFDRTLGLIGSALRDERSVAAFLHGSFGSGKSHFMALLSLMLDGVEEVWKVPELHPLRESHDFIGEKNLLQLRFHMVGHAGDLEDAIFARYVGHVRDHHPDADLPGLFADEQLFADAGRLLDELGEDAFFAPMNEGVVVTEGWGDAGAALLWHRERFERVSESDDPAKRAQLFSALVKTRFSAYAQESRAFVDLDSGLATMAQHAKKLGYDGIVLFLDELVLWLAGRASDSAWLHTEAQKMVKLVEAQEARRDVPLISFIARQRDLAEMVGDEYAGVENRNLRDSLQWGKGRYDTVMLEDRNLPAIVERRIRRPKDKAAEKALASGFEQLKRAAGASWETLLGEQDAEAFGKLYPFSPALVEALVALSNSLQRERTAIKLLMELLVEHIDDLALGQVVGVGDLFDVLAGGEDTADGIMKSRFESAKELYKYRLLPVIQASHGTTTEERCQRLRSGHPTRLGCSNCPERACRSDNQLAKTLVIASLVPEVSTFKGLTVSKLVQLNHGVLKVPIPGTETNLAVQKLRDWASQVGQVRVGEGADPTVGVMIEGVDLKPILDQARGQDTEGARKRVLRDLLFDAMGVLKIADAGRDHRVEWRYSSRLGHIRFGNVRTMATEQLRCPGEHDWRLVVDFPFDQPGFGPRDDEAVLDTFMEEGSGTWTLVWLPSFFSKAVNDLLGELVILDYILESSKITREFISHLSVENQARAKMDLESLRSQKRARIMQALDEAYGLVPAREGDLDGSQLAEKHLRVLKPGAEVQPTLAASLSDALDRYVGALLEARYPRHPRFSYTFSRQRVARLVDKFGEVFDSDDKWIAADKELFNEFLGTSAQLGLVSTPEGRIRLREDDMLQRIENKRCQLGVDQPSVEQIHHWMDENRKMGLKPEPADLVVRCYARWAARTLVRDGRAFEVQAGRPLPPDVLLEKPDLPNAAAWGKALNLAGAAFGITLSGKALHADNLKRFETALRKALEPVHGPATRLVAVLRKRAAEVGAPEDAARITTAASADKLCEALAGQPVVQQVEALASFEPKTSAKALGASLAHVSAIEQVLGDELVFGVFAQLRSLSDSLEGASELLERVAKAVRQDEINVALAPRLRELAVAGQKLIPTGPDSGNGDWVQLWSKQMELHGASEIVAKLEEALEQVKKQLKDAKEPLLVGKIELRGRKEP